MLGQMFVLMCSVADWHQNVGAYDAWLAVVGMAML